jgi:hypothetical protein
MVTEITISNEADAVLDLLRAQTRLGRGHLIEAAIEFLGTALCQGRPEALTVVKAKAESRSVIQIAADEIELLSVPRS